MAFGVPAPVPRAGSSNNSRTRFMIFFYKTTPDVLPRIAREGLRDVILTCSLDSVGPASSESILVIDAAEVSTGRTHVPAESIVNIDPYIPPKRVAAAGGIVVRYNSPAPDILLILRNGNWELPKGKCDENETARQCAEREVAEETGIQDLDVFHEIGTTIHTYERKGYCCVKYTTWFLMRSRATDFLPQADEGIRQVVWAPWPEAQQRLAYSSLRTFLGSLSNELSC